MCSPCARLRSHQCRERMWKNVPASYLDPRTCLFVPFYLDNRDIYTQLSPLVLFLLTTALWEKIPAGLDDDRAFFSS